MSALNAGKGLLTGAPPGTEFALSAYVVCEGRWPANLAIVEEHLKTCLSCQKEVSDYKEGLKADKYRNTTGWWDPYRESPLHDYD